MRRQSTDIRCKAKGGEEGCTGGARPRNPSTPPKTTSQSASESRVSHERAVKAVENVQLSKRLKPTERN
eukprot:1828566-Prymnesium_polylepis.1